MFMDPFQTDPAAEIDRQWYVECKVNLMANLWCILIPGIQMPHLSHGLIQLRPPFKRLNKPLSVKKY